MNKSLAIIVSAVLAIIVLTSATVNAVPKYGYGMMNSRQYGGMMTSGDYGRYGMYGGGPYGRYGGMMMSPYYGRKYYGGHMMMRPYYGGKYGMMMEDY